MTLIVDASVAVLWGIRDPLSADAESLLLSPQRLIAPDLILIEVANAAWKMARRGEIQAQQAGSMVERVPRTMSELVPLTELWPQALRIAQRIDHPVYDCCYLALAESRGCQLITLDKRLHTRTRNTPWAGLTALLGQADFPS